MTSMILGSASAVPGTVGAVTLEAFAGLMLDCLGSMRLPLKMMVLVASDENIRMAYRLALETHYNTRIDAEEFLMWLAAYVTSEVAISSRSI